MAESPTPPPQDDPVNILLVDDQPAKLLSYEVVLRELGDTLIKAGSAREALEHLLRTDVAVVLIDVCMPELDGFELATMIREHPRFQKIAIIFVSAIQISEIDSLRGYEAGAVDYVPVPVVPELLRAKVRIFAELYRKTRQLERLNRELEQRVVERTSALEASAERLRQSEERRTLALSAGRMGSWDWDLVADTLVWDKGQCRIFGVDSETFQPDAESVTALIHPDDRAAMQDIQPWSAENRSYDAEFRIVRPDGAIRHCVASGAVTFDGAGIPIRLSGVTHDITERKRTEEALQHLNEELEHRIEERTREREAALAQLFEAQKVDTIGHLTGGVAHDFNNLLMAVLGSLELLKKRLVPGDERASRLLDNAVQGAQRGAALTQRLLAFARRQELKPESVDVARLIAGMGSLLERALGPSVQVSRDLRDNLPSVLVDANQLELALLNLAVNARDAMTDGGSISISASESLIDATDGPRTGRLEAGRYVCIEVSDTGVGMDAATMARATEPFFTTKGPGKGTGLGLSMVQGLAAQSGGAMTIASDLGKGTTISLWLPLAEFAEAIPSRARRAASEPASSEATSGLVILVVDDDPLVIAGTTAMLEDLGHQVVEATSGQKAVDALSLPSSARIDLIITDHAMPGMTGLELARIVQERHPRMGIILASGYAEIPNNPGPVSLPRLPKPFRQSDLAAAIAAIVAKTQNRDAAVLALRSA